ncbi:MAG: rhomboid family intramembrane serine protease [archaeon]|nr:rhomboid family intramembrane serine protease [archaeon]
MKYYTINPKTSFLKSIFASFPITWWLIIITSVISIVGFIAFAIWPVSADYLFLKPSNIIHGKYLWTLITHMFLHGGFLHLFVNMFALFSLGGLCENIIGRKRMFWLYLLSGIFAGILSAVLAGFFGTGIGERIFGSPDIFMVGASGALFAVAGLFVIILPNVRFSIIFLPFFSLPAYIMVPLVLFIVWGITIAGDLPIGNVAHFGGFLIGVGYGLYLRTKYKKKIAMLDRYFRRC